jgi:hypothetical protein
MFLQVAFFLGPIGVAIIVPFRVYAHLQGGIYGWRRDSSGAPLRVNSFTLFYGDDERVRVSR